MSEVSDPRLLQFIERAERLLEEKQGIADDIKDCFGEMKAVGYDVKITKDLIKRRKLEREAVEEYDALLVTYEAAIG